MYNNEIDLLIIIWVNYGCYKDKLDTQTPEKSCASFQPLYDRLTKYFKIPTVMNS